MPLVEILRPNVKKRRAFLKIFLASDLNRSNRGARMNGGQPQVQNRFRSEGACLGDNFCFTTKDVPP
jgi:hypothetical protein